MTTTAAASSWLAQHVGNGHRLYALDGLHIRCKDCQQTGLLGKTSPDPTDPRSSIPHVTTGSGTTRRTGIPNINDPDTCQEHPGFWADNCGPCRSEILATPNNQPPTEPDPPHANPFNNPEWIAMRERFRSQP